MINKKKYKIDLDTYEKTYNLNFYSHEKEVVEFAVASWNLTSLFLSELHEIKPLSPKQKVCLYMLGKSMRLLRAVSKLVADGYWPEAEILFRAEFETQILLTYILRDETDGRAKKWLDRTNPKERWPMAEMLKDTHKSLETVYSNLSLYPHNHIISVINYIKIDGEGMLSIEKSSVGGKENNLKAAQLLGSTAMTNASMCEIAVPYFSLPSTWHETHIKLMQLAYFQRTVLTVKEFMSKEENLELLNKLLKK
jgi:hypothetical protein